ncbi:MAG: hypothetical protein GY717_14600 [Rhodobacteraceae bacterium]|nr:hypothetical protein [Paracoccaceae bacterium]
MKPETDEDEVLAVIGASMLRRWLAMAVMVGSGAALIWFGLGAETTGALWKLCLVALGAGLIVLADAMRRATSRVIELTRGGLRETDGRVLCAFDEIAKVERGAFSMKPPNGLLVRLNVSRPVAWAPGLWWRYGRKLGIGGVTPVGQAKFMADMIGLLLMEQDGTLPDLAADRD